MMTSSLRRRGGSFGKQVDAGRRARGAVPGLAASGLALGFFVCYAAFGGAEALAQQGIGFGVTSTNPNVFINNDVLNSLGPAGPVAAAPYYGGSPFVGGYGGSPFVGGYGAQPVAPQGTFVLTRPGTLLFPPAAYPRSHLVNRDAAIALNQPAVSAPAASAPQLTAPSPGPRAPAPPRQVATQPAPKAPAAPRAAPKAQGQAGLAPPPPVPAGSAPKAPPAPAAETTGAIPTPPAPTSADTSVAEAGSDTQLTPPPPPAAVAENAEPEAPSQATAADSTAAIAPPPPAVAAAPEAPAPTQEAAVPPAAEDPVDGELRLLFTPGKADLSTEVKSSLQALARDLVSDGNARVQLLAYATSSDDSASRARRLSLSRALAVRAFLIDQGVRSTRMDVRALGDKAESDPKDRVDIKPARR